jgi:hypothetical protein
MRSTAAAFVLMKYWASGMFNADENELLPAFGSCQLALAYGVVLRTSPASMVPTTYAARQESLWVGNDWSS